MPNQLTKGLCIRASLDLEIRAKIFNNDRRVEIPQDSLPIWQWLVDVLKVDTQLEITDKAPTYPTPLNKTALWYSGGVESTYTLEHIRKENPVLLNIEDYPLFQTSHRKIGQIHFLCAVMTASLGFAKTYMGVERNDLLLAKNRFARRYVERSPSFLDIWSQYRPENQMLTLCGHLYKEEIIEWLWHRKIPITGTCDRLKNGQWCGDCFKCFEAFYSAKAIGINLGFKLTRRGFDQYYNEYNDFLNSGFQNNYNNAYAHFTRLQILYHLEFLPDTDCC